jgi:hypothetical protein
MFSCFTCAQPTPSSTSQAVGCDGEPAAGIAVPGQHPPAPSEGGAARLPQSTSGSGIDSSCCGGDIIGDAHSQARWQNLSNGGGRIATGMFDQAANPWSNWASPLVGAATSSTADSSSFCSVSVSTTPPLDGGSQGSSPRASLSSWFLAGLDGAADGLYERGRLWWRGARPPLPPRRSPSGALGGDSPRAAAPLTASRRSSSEPCFSYALKHAEEQRRLQGGQPPAVATTSSEPSSSPLTAEARAARRASLASLHPAVQAHLLGTLGIAFSGGGFR